MVQRWQSLSPVDVRQYNEENTKNIFIQPLFRGAGLGLSRHRRGNCRACGGTGRVDFAFRVNGVSRFYLEAKPLRDESVVQLGVGEAGRGYAYGKGNTLGDSHELQGAMGFYRRWRQALHYIKRGGLCTASIGRLWLLSKESVTSGLLERQLGMEGTIPSQNPRRAASLRSTPRLA